MKQNDGYLLHKMEGAYYILPYRQQVLGFHKGIKTNEAGAFLWNALEKECSKKALLKQYIEYCHVNENEISGAEKDMDFFLNQLRKQNMLCEEEKILPFPSDHCIYAEIAGITLKLVLPASSLAAGFQDFLISSPKTPDQTIEVYYNMPHNHPNGTILLRSRQFLLCDTGKQYLILFPNSPTLVEAYLHKDGSRAVFYCNPAEDGKLSQELFSAIRFTYLYLAQKKACLPSTLRPFSIRDTHGFFLENPEKGNQRIQNSGTGFSKLPLSTVT